MCITFYPHLLATPYSHLLDTPPIHTSYPHLLFTPPTQENRLLQRERDLSAVAWHELKNPLNCLAGYLRLMHTQVFAPCRTSCHTPVPCHRGMLPCHAAMPMPPCPCRHAHAAMPMPLHESCRCSIAGRELIVVTHSLSSYLRLKIQLVDSLIPDQYNG